MGLRDALVDFVDGEEPAAFLARALEAAHTAGGSGRLRLEVGRAFSLLSDPPGSYCGVSLWVERGVGRTESWQKVTGQVLADDASSVLALFSRALDLQQSVEAAGS